MHFLELLTASDEQLSVEERCRKEFLSHRPNWDRYAMGIWDYPAVRYDEDGIPLPKDKQSKPTRWKPGMHAVCFPLFGVEVAMPTLERACAIYAEAIEILMTYRLRADIFILALHRRQIEVDDLDLDRLYFACVRDWQKPLTYAEWLELANRMPPHSQLRARCLQKAFPRGMRLEGTKALKA